MLKRDVEWEFVVGTADSVEFDNLLRLSKGAEDPDPVALVWDGIF